MKDDSARNLCPKENMTSKCIRVQLEVGWGCTVLEEFIQDVCCEEVRRRGQRPPPRPRPCGRTSSVSSGNSKVCVASVQSHRR